VVERFPVRVTVTDAWDVIELAVTDATTVAELKRRALDEAMGPGVTDPAAYLVKFRGAAVLDEQMSVSALGAGPNVPFIVLPRRRQPVR
jgi:hypothetical protein